MPELISYLPEVLRGVYEFRQLAAAESVELSAADEELKNIVADNFIETLTERGCSRWEKMLGITPKSPDDIEVRRFRILSKLNEELPFTFKGLKRQLAILCGGDGFTAELDNKKYLLSVQVALTAKNQYDEVGKLLEREIPANMEISLSLKYNQHLLFSDRTHGSLAAYTHEHLRNEVMT